MDVHHGAGGDVTDLFEPYRPEENRRIVEESAALIPIADAEQAALVAWVDSTYRTRNMRF